MWQDGSCVQALPVGRTSDASMGDRLRLSLRIESTTNCDIATHLVSVAGQNDKGCSVNATNKSRPATRASA